MGAYSVLTFIVLVLAVLLLWREYEKMQPEGGPRVPPLEAGPAQPEIDTLYWMEGN